MEAPSPETLARLGRDKLLAICDSYRFEPDPNSSPLQLAQFLCEKLSEADPGAIGPFSAAEARLLRTEFENRLEKLAQTTNHFPEQLHKVEERMTELLQRAENKLLEASAATTVQFKELDAARHQAEQAVRDAVADARLTCKDMEKQVESAKTMVAQIDAQQEKRQAFLQKMTAVVVGSSGAVTLLVALVTLVIGFLAKEGLTEVRRLTDKTQTLLQTNAIQSAEIASLASAAKAMHSTNEFVLSQAREVAANLKKTDSGLLQYLFLSLSERCQQLAEKTSFRLTPEEVRDVKRELEHLEPFFNAAVQTFRTNNSNVPEVELYHRLEGYRTNILATLSVSEMPLEQRDAKLISSLGNVLQSWQTLPTNITGWSEPYLKTVSTLVASRENMIGAAKLLIWTKEQQPPANLDQITNHFTLAITLDPNFSRPWNSLAFAYDRLMTRELLSTNPAAAKIRQYYTIITNFYEQADARAKELRTRMVLRNNQTTTYYKFADFLARIEGNTNEAAQVYEKCRMAISKGYQVGVPDSGFLETHAESIGIEFLLNESLCQTSGQEREKRETKILGLLTAARDAGLRMASSSNFLSSTPIRFVTNNSPQFSPRLDNVLSGKDRVDLR
jgi:hypothetical protein